MEEESTKPYVYYERILNGISEIPESIKQKLDHLILIKNENNRIEEAEQKETEEREAEEQKEAEEQREAQEKEAETQPTNLSEKFGQLYKTVSNFIPKTLAPVHLPEPIAPVPLPVEVPLQAQVPLPDQVQLQVPVQAPVPLQVPDQMRKCKIREW